MVFDEADGPDLDTLWLADLEAHSVRALAKAEPGYDVWSPDIYGSAVAWVEYHYDKPARAQGDVTWRVLVTDVAGGSPKLIATGKQTRLSAGAAFPPKIAIDRDNLAIATEQTSSDHPRAWRVDLYSLDNPTDPVEEFVSEEDIYRLDMSDSTVAYSEGQADTTGDFIYDTRLMVVPPGPATATEVDRDAFEVAIADGTVAWMEDKQGGLSDSPMPFTPVIMTARVGDAAGNQVSITTAAPTPPEGWSSPRLGGMYPAVGDGLIAWQDLQTDGTWDGHLYRVVAYDIALGRAFQLEPSPNPMFVSLGGGWLVWNTDFTPDRHDIALSVNGIHVEELRQQFR